MAQPPQPQRAETLQRLDRRDRIANVLDGALFAFAGAAAIWLAYLLFRETLHGGWEALLFVVFWVVFSYLLLPRLHRILTRIYVPGYFIGRARTGDGLLADPINVSMLGNEGQVHQAMVGAGWTRADDLDGASTRRMIASTLRRKSYPTAPVNPLNLFDRQQDFAYQMEVAGSPSKRHHVRFWHAPFGWMLPGGFPVDWVAAGTYDRSVGVNFGTFQVTHKLEENTDVERDFIVSTVAAGDTAVTVNVIRNFSTGYHSHTGGGDRIRTDGDMPILDLTNVDAPHIARADVTDSRDKRPSQTVFGAAFAFLRGLVYLLFAVIVIVLAAAGDAPGGGDLSRYGPAIATVLGVAGLIEIGLGFAVLAGRNWARLALMLYCVLTTVAAFVSNARGSNRISLTTNLPTVGISILVLLALSSHRARDYALHRRWAKAGGAATVTCAPTPDTP